GDVRDRHETRPQLVGMRCVWRRERRPAPAAWMGRRRRGSSV
ncbi:MAG: hypothetical protein AVDCRST_MAG71-2391, partial [uncultured Lysobacter sp.]